MTNYDFYRHADAVRKTCKGMDRNQVKSLIALLKVDLDDRVGGAESRPAREDVYRSVADALFHRGEAVYAERVIHRVGDTQPVYRVGQLVCDTVSEAMEAIDRANKAR